MGQLLYTFGNGVAEGHGTMRALLGGKGASLAEMSRLGLPVPPGFTITTEVCAYYLAHEHRYPSALAAHVAKGLRGIEAQVQRQFGDPDRPLLVSVRSGSPVSMPGMMDTILNLGLNDVTVEGLSALSGNPRFAYDSYRRFIQMYANVVLGLDHEQFEQILARQKQQCGVTTDAALEANTLRVIVEEFKQLVQTQTQQAFPQDPQAQLWGAIGAIMQSWNNRRAVEYRRIHQITQVAGTACTVQAMVFGNLGESSATGVAFTRDPVTGEPQLYGEYLLNAQGEDVVAGLRTPQPIATLPMGLPTLEQMRQQLEHHYRDLQDIEFTIEEGTVWLLQTRTGKRTARAAVKVAVDLVREGMLTPREAVLRVDAQHLDQLLHPMLVTAVAGPSLAQGLAASPGGAVGRVVFTADDAVAWQQRGERVLLVRHETSPDDIHGMHVAEGFLTARGGLTSHAAVVARGMGKPCVAGCEALQIDAGSKCLTLPNGTVLHEGEWLSIDGSSGGVFAGQVPVERAQPSPELRELLQWADAARRLRVRANADTRVDAEQALRFGAEGIGLARTEHMFFGPGRIERVREMILAADDTARRQALKRLLPLQQQDFYDLLEVMQGRPVTIRLLDPPLHEFLPQSVADFETMAAQTGRAVTQLQALVEQLREANPMLGHRGCRLGLTAPEIYETQVRAMFWAACRLRKTHGVSSALEIEVPFLAHTEELRRLRAMITRIAAEGAKECGAELPFQLGAMLELPRACLMAGEFAAELDFLSFGTNDLTQTTLGISRDDAGHFLPRYVREGILDHDPFVSIDRPGVGELMRIAVMRARQVKPDIVMGICGEHGGDPSSIAFCAEIGLDYVSCSPYRVPAARLAAAQAALHAAAGPTTMTLVENH